MDVKDFEKELGDIKPRPVKPRRQVDLSVKNANIKVALSKALAVLFVLAVALFAIFTVTSANTADVDVRILIAMAAVYLLLGAFVAYKLWNLEFFGWVALMFISLAGIALPAMSAATHGLAVGTMPIIGASLITIAVLWWIRDLYRVKRVGDIFSYPVSTRRPPEK